MGQWLINQTRLDEDDILDLADLFNDATRFYRANTIIHFTDFKDINQTDDLEINILFHYLFSCNQKCTVEKTKRIVNNPVFNIKHADVNGGTALMWACYSRVPIDVYRLLIQRGADLNARTIVYEHTGESTTLLYWYFADERFDEIVEDEIMLFLKSGYDITQANLPEFLQVKYLYLEYWIEKKVRIVMDVSAYK